MKITEGRLRLAASDVANFLACGRLTQLDLLRARGSCGRSASSTSGSRIWSGAGRCTSGPCWSGSAQTGA